MEQRLWELDPARGVTTFFHFDHADDSWWLEDQQDVTTIVEANTRSRNDAADHWQGDQHRVASIPVTVYDDLVRRGIADDPARFAAWLNDPDNGAFRTKRGRL